MVDKVSPNDSRIQYKTANLNGVTYSYILAEPADRPKNTIVLIHGWPDLSLGWRYQIPLLTSLGFRVLVPAPRAVESAFLLDARSPAE